MLVRNHVFQKQSIPQTTDTLLLSQVLNFKRAHACLQHTCSINSLI